MSPQRPCAAAAPSVAPPPLGPTPILAAPPAAPASETPDSSASPRHVDPPARDAAAARGFGVAPRDAEIPPNAFFPAVPRRALGHDAHPDGPPRLHAAAVVVAAAAAAAVATGSDRDAACADTGMAAGAPEPARSNPLDGDASRNADAAAHCVDGALRTSPGAGVGAGGEDARVHGAADAAAALGATATGAGATVAETAIPTAPRPEAPSRERAGKPAPPRIDVVVLPAWPSRRSSGARSASSEASVTLTAIRMAQSSATASPSASVRCFAQRRHHDLLLSRQERAFRAYLAVEERGARATDRQFHRVAALLQTLINDGQRALLVADAAAAIGTDDRTSRFAPSGLLTVASGIMALYHRLAADDDGGQPAMDDAPWIIDADAATAATPDEADDDDDDDDDDTTPTPASVSAWTAQRAAAAATAAPVKPASPRPTAAALAAARSPSLYGQPVTPVSDDDDDARTPRASAFPRAKPRGASDGRLPSSLGVAARTAAAAAPLGPAMVTPPQEAGGSAAAPHGGSVMGTLGGFLKQRIWPGTSPAAAEAPLRSPAAHRV